MENMENNKSDNMEKLKKKPVKNKFNSYLRKKSKNKINPITPPIDIEDDILDSNNTSKESNPHIFYLIRQKYENNLLIFIDQLNQDIKEKQFNDILKNKMDLFSYSCLYEREDILNYLENNYLNNLDYNQFCNNVIPISIKKSPTIISCVINMYEKSFSSEKNSQLISSLIDTICQFSYRFENNELLLDWIAPKMTIKEKQDFWNKCFSYNNVSLINRALEHNILNSFLKENLNIYEQEIEKIGRKNEIMNKLKTSIKTKIKIQDIKFEENANTTNYYSSCNEERILTIKETQAPSKPQITVKKKRISV